MNHTSILLPPEFTLLAFNKAIITLTQYVLINDGSVVAVHDYGLTAAGSSHSSRTNGPHRHFLEHVVPLDIWILSYHYLFQQNILTPT
jgi:hypothetical protein